MFPNEKVIETKTCKHCNKSFNIYEKDVEYLENLSPIIGGQKFLFPEPDMCPFCREQRRFAFRNEGKLFRRKDNYSGKDIISIYAPDVDYIVYDEKIYISDVWDAKDYSKEFDFTRPFFEQFDELFHKVPLEGFWRVNCENSLYCNAARQLKNCYLIFSSDTCENCYYSDGIVLTNNSMDCLYTTQADNCYECVICLNCYNVMYSYNVKNCRNSRFLLDCDGCQNCYGCFGLENKQYCIFNKEFTKEEYEEELKKLSTLSIIKQKEKFKIFFEGNYNRTPLPNIGSENVSESEYVRNSRNVYNSKNIVESEDVRHCQNLQSGVNKFVMDISVYGRNIEKSYFDVSIGADVLKVNFCSLCSDNVSNLLYCVGCMQNVHNCFGCIGLRNAEYCILNKQYTKEEYETLVPKIIEHMKKTGEWGEFFPATLSPFGYNDTLAGKYYPLTREEALKQGFKWNDYEAPIPKVDKIIPGKMLPDDISKVPDDVLNWAIECEVTKKLFLILKQELEFYRKHNLPIPKRHPEQRGLDRMKWYVNR